MYNQILEKKYKEFPFKTSPERFQYFLSLADKIHRPVFKNNAANKLSEKISH